MLHKNYFCGAPKKYAPHKFLISVARVGLVRHRTLPFCSACGRMRHRVSMGLTRGPALHMGEGKLCDASATCATESQNFVARMGICATEVHLSGGHATES
jgi:hypothetical protein